MLATPEGQRIAQGVLAYLNVKRELKAVHDASNRFARIPIMTAEFVDVSLAATLAFVRARGLDDLVDAYAVHTYPSGRTPAARLRPG